MAKPKQSRRPKYGRLVDLDTLTEKSVEIVERNGGLLYVEDEQGNRDWVGAFMVEDR